MRIREHYYPRIPDTIDTLEFIEDRHPSLPGAFAKVDITTTKARTWLPTPAPSRELEAARAQITKLGLRALGGREGDAFLIGVRPLTGTIEVVSPVSLPAFSYTLPLKDPSVRVHWADSGRVPLPLDRSAEGFHHLGDVTMRLRPAGSSGRYTTHSTVAKKAPLATAASEVLLTSDGAASLDASDCLAPKHPSVRLHRTVNVHGSDVVFNMTLTNTDPTAAVEIGALGFSVPMNQMFTGRTLPEVARRCSFTEVYLGGEAGYVQVTRTTGEGPTLLVMPWRDGAQGGDQWRGFEGWRPLKWEDRANYDWMHEMLYEVVIHSKAYADAEWRGAAPWAPATSAVLQPGASASYGLRLRLAENVERVADALLAAASPVAVPLPGSSINIDMRVAKLQVFTPPGLRLVTATAEPPGCAELGSPTPHAPAEEGHLASPGTEAVTLQTLSVLPKLVGRCRLALDFRTAPSASSAASAAPLRQYVHYMILERAAQLLQRHGDFAATVGWLPANSTDPWHRGPVLQPRREPRCSASDGTQGLCDTP